MKSVGDDLESELLKPRNDPDLLDVKKRVVIWAAALSTFAHTQNNGFGSVGAAVAHETGWSDARGFHPYKS